MFELPLSVTNSNNLDGIAGAGYHARPSTAHIFLQRVLAVQESTHWLCRRDLLTTRHAQNPSSHYGSNGSCRLAQNRGLCSTGNPLSITHTSEYVNGIVSCSELTRAAPLLEGEDPFVNGLILPTFFQNEIIYTCPNSVLKIFIYDPGTDNTLK